VAVAPADLHAADPFRHVGIAYDGSSEAQLALEAGYAIAAGSGAAVTLFYAIPESAPVETVGRPAHAEASARRLRLRAQDVLDAAAEAAPTGVNPRTVLLYGLPSLVIPGACGGIVDLLVTGSRGYGPVQRALIGSVSEALMNGAAHPVLVLPRSARTGAPAADDVAALPRSG
jgi:nucleotide-binding universal stress UspA family protein